MKKSFRSLFVWNESVDLAVRISVFADVLVRRRRFALADQIQRAALSVPSNIAEGKGRITDREARYFFGVARGSLFELETQLEVCLRSRLLSEATFAEMRRSIAQIGAGLTKLISASR